MRRRRIDGPVRRLDGFSRPVSMPQAPAVKPDPEPELEAEPQAPSRPFSPVAAGGAPVSPAAVLVGEPIRMRQPRARRITPRRILAAVLLLAIAAGVFFGAKLYLAAQRITGGRAVSPALLGVFDTTKLRGESEGRINVLLLGIGGAGHDAPNLSDTIMMASIDPKTKDVAMISIPRDLYVQIPGRGYGKINSAHAAGGPALSSRVVSRVLDQPIHYYAVIDFAGFKQAIDAVGGIEVVVDKPLYDPTYPCDGGRRRYCPLKLKAGKQFMNGSTALRYARSRKTTSDFDRAKRQQKVLMALREKSLQASTLTNPVKLSGLIDALGGHVKTDLQINEVKALAELGRDVDKNRIESHVLDTAPDGLLVDGTGRIPGAGSIELPKAGAFDYSEIAAFAANIFLERYIKSEAALIEVQNGTAVPGLATTVAESLRAGHFKVLDPGNADQEFARTHIYDYTNGQKPQTVRALEKRFGVRARQGTLSEASGTGAAATSGAAGARTGAASPKPHIRVVIGSDYEAVISSDSASDNGMVSR